VVEQANGGPLTYRLFFHQPSWQAFENCLYWLRRTAAADSVVATTSPHLAYLRSGLRAVLPPLEVDPARAQALLDAVPARYLIVDDLSFVDLSRRYGQPVIDRFPERWRLVYAEGSPGARVYERVD
jgi:hypothetical protein